MGRREFEAAIAESPTLHASPRHYDREFLLRRLPLRSPLDRMWMVRLGIPTGVLTSAQYLLVDDLCEQSSDRDSDEAQRRPSTPD